MPIRALRPVSLVRHHLNPVVKYIKNVREGYKRTWRSPGSFSHWEHPLGAVTRFELGILKAVDLALVPLKPGGTTLETLRKIMTVQSRLPLPRIDLGTFGHNTTGAGNDRESVIDPSPFDFSYYLAAARREERQGEDELSKFEIEHPAVHLEDVGGVRRAKKEIGNLITALKNHSTFQTFADFPKGILFFGPPGTGKTLLARVIATEMDASFIYVQSTDIIDMWVGNSEKALKKIFTAAQERARETGKPVVIYIDEIDGLVPARTERTHEATGRMISTLLQLMQGITPAENVVVIASTNRKKAMDPAVLRAGRFDLHIEVPLPQTAEERKEIFAAHIRRIDREKVSFLDMDIVTDEVLEETAGFSGADIAEVLMRAQRQQAILAVTNSLQSGNITSNQLLEIIKDFKAEREISGEKNRSIGFC